MLDLPVTGNKPDLQACVRKILFEGEVKLREHDGVISEQEITRRLRATKLQGKCKNCTLTSTNMSSRDA